MKFPILYTLLPLHKRKVFFYKGHTIATSCRFSLISLFYPTRYLLYRQQAHMHCHIKTINCLKVNIFIISSILCITVFLTTDENTYLEGLTKIIFYLWVWRLAHNCSCYGPREWYTHLCPWNGRLKKWGISPLGMTLASM